jgi:transposase
MIDDLHQVLDGRLRSEAASSKAWASKPCATDWVHRYNKAGVEGLQSRRPPGRPAFLTDQQMAEL